MNAIDPRGIAALRATRGFTPRYDERVQVDAQQLETLIAQRLYDLRFHLIDLLEVSSNYPLPVARLQRICARLAPFGYRPVVLPTPAPAQAGPAAAPSVQLRLASPRLTEPQVDGFRDAASRAAVLARHGIQCRGVIQVGAHVGQEVPLFIALGAQRLMLVEANPTVYRTLQHNVQAHGAAALLANCAITDFDGETELMLTSFDQSSSLLPLAHHSVEYPQIREVGKVRVPARRLDTLVQREFSANPSDYNVLEIDVQGAEGLVLRGAPEQLAATDAVYVEINFKAMYEGCLLIDAIDALLLDAGLSRIQTHCAHSLNWGDALYVRRPRTVTMTSLGRNGRLGNQVFQYNWLRVLADEHGLQARCPAGDLGTLFDLGDLGDLGEHAGPAEPDRGTAEALAEQALLSLTPFSEQTARCAQGCDLSGYFQFHTALWRDRRDQFRRRLPLTAANRRLEAAIRAVFQRRGRAIVIHYRQSDFNQFAGSPVFYIAPLQWYVDAVRELRDGPTPSFVYVASDAALDVQPLRDLGVDVIGSEELRQELSPELRGEPADPLALDFLALKAADALLISNSTFSFAASLLNEHCRLFLRPDAPQRRLRVFDPWHSEVLLGLPEEEVRFATRAGAS